MNKIYKATIPTLSGMGVVEDAYFYNETKAKRWTAEESGNLPNGKPYIEEIEMYDDSKIMPMKRKAELYNELLGYLVELISDEEELQNALLSLGFTMEEIRYECLEYKEGDNEETV